MSYDKQIKTKKRVADHGEVFTSEREVNSMLDLVKQETERIDSRFLEPACGNGNFLSEILNRKLNVIENKYKKSQIEFERYTFIAMTSIYGVDILQDNVDSCRERLYKMCIDLYKKLYKSKCKKMFENAIGYVLKKNIVCGDALTMLNSNQTPIAFAEWSMVQGSMIKRRDYTFTELLVHTENNENCIISDKEEPQFIPNTIKEYPTIHFMKVSEYE